eukprot:tig00020704_g13201.t1
MSAAFLAPAAGFSAHRCADRYHGDFFTRQRPDAALRRAVSNAAAAAAGRRKLSSHVHVASADLPVDSTASAENHAEPAAGPSFVPAPTVQTRRAFAAAAAALALGVCGDPASAVAEKAPRITSKVFLDFRIGNLDVGRVEFGLYGDIAPNIVKTFRALCTGEVPGLTYRNSSFFLAFELIRSCSLVPDLPAPGRQLTPFSRSPDFRSAAAFAARHDRGGLLCTAISFNEPEFSGFEYIVTAGPAPELDGSSLVFGEVLSGQGVLERMSLVPVVQPNDNKAFWIDFGKKYLKDERAALAQAAIFKPLTKVLVTNCGSL